MSQLRFYSKDMSLEFLTGWDRPLRYFFLVVSRLENGEDVETLFSNLKLKDPGMSIQAIKDVCLEFKTPLPDGVEKQMLKESERV